VQPIVSVGAGVYRARVTGVGAPNFDGSRSDTWSALAVIGAGLIVPVVSRVALVADAQVGVTWPDNLIRLNFVDAGRLGRPSLLASAGALATF
jgi:hypothetical protein